MLPVAKCSCGSTVFEEGGFGLDSCTQCGLAKVVSLKMNNSYLQQDRLQGNQSYTRLKRFKKYLCRAMRQQSFCTVPRETWDYLLSKAPFRDSKHIQFTLKQARHLKRKCYDSLPFLTSQLCSHITVPCISQAEKQTALDMFSTIDKAIDKGPFISYLFCLEYILKRMGRHDVCEHLNQIQCPKRREKYKARLDGIFERPRADISALLRARA